MGCDQSSDVEQGTQDVQKTNMGKKRKNGMTTERGKEDSSSTTSTTDGRGATNPDAEPRYVGDAQTTTYILSPKAQKYQQQSIENQHRQMRSRELYMVMEEQHTRARAAPEPLTMSELYLQHRLQTLIAKRQMEERREAAAIAAAAAWFLGSATLALIREWIDSTVAPTTPSTTTATTNQQVTDEAALYVDPLIAPFSLTREPTPPPSSPTLPPQEGQQQQPMQSMPQRELSFDDRDHGPLPHFSSNEGADDATDSTPPSFDLLQQQPQLSLDTEEQLVRMLTDMMCSITVFQDDEPDDLISSQQGEEQHQRPYACASPQECSPRERGLCESGARANNAVSACPRPDALEELKSLQELNKGVATSNGVLLRRGAATSSPTAKQRRMLEGEVLLFGWGTGRV